MTQAQHTKLLICHTYTQDTDLHLFVAKKTPRISTKLHLLPLVPFCKTECLPKFAMVKRKKRHCSSNLSKRQVPKSTYEMPKHKSPEEPQVGPSRLQHLPEEKQLLGLKIRSLTQL